MRLVPLIVLYALTGVVLSYAAFALKRTASLIDVGLVAMLWPIFAPLVLLRATPAEVGAVRGRLRASRALEVAEADRELEALDAKIASARREVEQMDVLLARPGFRRAEAAERAADLRSRGEFRAAEIADERGASIARLEKLRAQLGSELTQVDELREQLAVQVELLRRTGEGRDGVVLVELTSRVETLDALLGSHLEI